MSIVEVTGVRNRVLEVLRDAILDGVLQSGERLNEQHLADELGVSRPPLREAIRVLEQEGLVQSRPRRGTFVRDLTGADIMEIYDVRCALELSAAYSVTIAQDEKVFGKLERSLERELEPGLELRDIINRDLQFHRLLVKSAGNRRLIEMWEQLVGQLRLALIRVDPVFFEATFVLATHRPLIEAMRARDLERVTSIIGGFNEVAESLRNRWGSVTKS